MGDDQYGPAYFSEVLLEPLDPLQVQVVRGLIEQQQVMIRYQLARQRDAVLLPTGEGAGLALPELFSETNTGEHGLHPALGLPTAQLIHATGQLVVLPHQPVQGIAGGCAHLIANGLDSRQQQLGLVQPGLHVVAHAQTRSEHRSLGYEAHARPAPQGYRPPIGGFLSGDDPEERRLPTAIASHDAKDHPRIQ